MEEQIKILNEKVDKLQATIDKIAEQMQFLQRCKIIQPPAFRRKTVAASTSNVNERFDFIGDGSFSSLNLD